MKAAIIVAHPDDEIIWAGGTIMDHAEWDWTVLSLCRADDADREPKFRRVAELLGFEGFISDLDDGNPPAPINTHREIGHRISDELGETRWDVVLTHGPAGEYGHPRHIQTHNEVLRVIADGLLSCRELWTFACDCDVVSCACRMMDDADVRIHLTDEQLAEKKRIVRDVYGYPETSFEVRACVTPEGFYRRFVSAEE